MINKKPTDNEIVKALECCLADKMICEECPIQDECESHPFEAILAKYSLDLINRQKAEIENLNDILYDAEGVNLVNYWHQQCGIAENGCRNFSKENESLKAEIERLQNILICFMDALGKVRKLDDIDEISLIPLMSELNKQYRINLKAEAYKELADKLERAFSKSESQMPNSEVVKQTVQICRNAIRIVVNELVGD